MVENEITNYERIHRRLLIAVTVFLAASSLSLHAADAPKKMLLVTVTKGYRHSFIPTAIKVIGELAEKSKRPEIQRRTMQDNVMLTDGGVYDNLAVEPMWRRYKTLFVSAGRPFESIDDSGQGIFARLQRAAEISMEQVAAVRKRWLVEDFLGGRRTGAIWTLHTRLDDFPLSDKRGYGADACQSVQKVRTDLDAFSEPEIACLENHGYSLADAALRSRAPALAQTYPLSFSGRISTGATTQPPSQRSPIATNARSSETFVVMCFGDERNPLRVVLAGGLLQSSLPF